MQTTYEQEAVGMVGQKRKPSLCAINAQRGTSLQIAPPVPSPHRIGKGNSRKFPANSTTEQ